jgi:hypothetical protein
MAIIDRVKKRVETDLDDTELQLLIDEANQDIINKFGPHANSAAPITVRLDGRRKELVLDRAIDTSQAVVVKEYVSEYGWGETITEIDDTDYRISSSGLVLERLTTGPNSWPRWSREVEITYTPINDGDQREEVIIKLVILAIEYTPATSGYTAIGDVTKYNPDYQAERDKLLNSLAPRPGLYLA